jgi:hypothetical protein
MGSKPHLPGTQRLQPSSNKICAVLLMFDTALFVKNARTYRKITLWSLFSLPFTQRGPTTAAIVEDRNATTPKKVRHQ